MMLSWYQQDSNLRVLSRTKDLKSFPLDQLGHDTTLSILSIMINRILYILIMNAIFD